MHMCCLIEYCDCQTESVVIAELSFVIAEL